MPGLCITFAKRIIVNHEKIKIVNTAGAEVDAVAPVIVSASRATDIPAFYADRFFDRLERGYITWRNPFNGRDSYVSFAATRFIVFWSKNPELLIPYLNLLKDRGIGFYIQFTLNDYDKENFEPRVPGLPNRIDTFKRIVDEYGFGSVVWRFDPLILTDVITSDILLEKVGRIAEQLKGYTEKLVFSFADIASYRSVARNMRNFGVNYREWTISDMDDFARRLSEQNDSWNFELATCAEPLDLERYGIAHNRCIDPTLISRRAQNDVELQRFLHKVKRDSGQRKACGCILSKDIGAYNTCPHLCKYCYANYAPSTVLTNYRQHNHKSESII